MWLLYIEAVKFKTRYRTWCTHAYMYTIILNGVVVVSSHPLLSNCLNPKWCHLSGIDIWCHHHSGFVVLTLTRNFLAWLLYFTSFLSFFIFLGSILFNFGLHTNRSKDSSISRISCRILGWGTALNLRIRPSRHYPNISINMFRTFPVPSVRTGWILFHGKTRITLPQGIQNLR